MEEVIKALSVLGVDVMLKDIDGDTPLHVGIGRECLMGKVCEDRECAEVLMANGAKYDAPNNEGKTARFACLNDA